MRGKALDSTQPLGHRRSYIQSTQTTHVTLPKTLKINWTTEPSGWLSGLHVRQKRMRKLLAHLITWKGRVSRTTFWLLHGILFLAYIILAYTVAALPYTVQGYASVAIIALLIMRWFVEIQRWHDRNKSGWNILIGIIPILGPIWILIECGFLKGTEGGNRFGAAPVGFSSNQMKEIDPMGQLSDEQAQEIVYAFIDIMKDGAPYIGDEETLPFPKEIIRKAFGQHIQHYTNMRSINEEAYNRMGYAERVKELEALSVHIDDWYRIHPEDKKTVAKLNKTNGPPPEWALPIMVKYMKKPKA
jgi:uncharacterized membrane protein YhaH (DUF805 family)